MEKRWKIRITKESDAQAIFSLLFIGWLDAHVNDDIGVTSDFIISRRLKMLRYPFYENGVRFDGLGNTKDNMHFVAVDKRGIIVGLIHANRDSEGQHLQGLYIYKEFQGTGLAQDLMARFEGWEDKSLDTQLGVVEYNKRAIKFYEKYGFKDYGVKYNIEDKIPCIDMVKLNKKEK